MIKIISVDSQRDRLEPLRLILNNEGYSMQTFNDGLAALGAIQRMAPDLVLINLPTPKIDGVTLLDRIRTNSIAPVVMLSPVRDEIEEIMSLRLGADDYIYGAVSPRLLSERIKGLLRRHAALLAHGKSHVVAEKSLICGDLTVDPDRHEVIWKNQAVILTSTEFQILLALARRPGVVKSREQLVSASYSEENYVDCRTIDCHIKRMRKKLREIDPGFASIETLYGIGYRFTQPGEQLRQIPKLEAPAAKFNSFHAEAGTGTGPVYLRAVPSQRETSAMANLAASFS